MSIEFKHPNGQLDDSDHVHAWYIPVESGHLGTPNDKYTLSNSGFCWCTLCGAIGWGSGFKKVILNASYLYGQGKLLRQTEGFKEGYKQAAKDTIKEASKTFESAVILSNPSNRREVDYKATVLRDWASDLMNGPKEDT